MAPSGSEPAAMRHRRGDGGALPGRLGERPDRTKQDLELVEDLSHEIAKSDPGFQSVQGGAAIAGPRDPRPGPILPVDSTELTSRIKNLKRKAEFARQTGLTAFLNDEDMKLPEMMAAQGERLTYDEWKLAKWPLDNPLTKQFMEKTDPDFVARAIQTHDATYDFNKVRHRILTFGPETEEEMRWLFLHETGRLDPRLMDAATVMYKDAGTRDPLQYVSADSIGRAFFERTFAVPQARTYTDATEPWSVNNTLARPAGRDPQPVPTTPVLGPGNARGWRGSMFGMPAEPSGGQSSIFPSLF